MKASQLARNPSHELVLGLRSAVGQGTLGKLPDSFVRVEFRRVAGKPKEVEPREGALQRSDRFSPVDRSVVPDQQHGSTQMTQQVTEEITHLRMLDVLGVEAEVQAQAPPTRTHRKSRDHGDAISALTMTEQRGLAARGPGPLHTWD